jgi:4'-phosphopantetheinyl transferase
MPTTVWIASLERAGAAADAFAPLLTPPEADRRRSFLHESDRRRFTLGRALARLAAAHALGCDARAIAIALDASGRPRLAPGAPALSIAHAGDLVAVALGTDGDVGVDVEPLDRALDVDTLVPLVCDPAEARALRALEPLARPARLLSLWSLKEACLKATGAGLSTDPRDVVFAFDAHGQPVAVRTPQTRTAAQGRWIFTLRSGCAGHVLAVAVHASHTAAAPVFADASVLLARPFVPE